MNHRTMSTKSQRLLPSVHPGDVLREDFVQPLGLSASAVAKAIGTTPIAISQIMRGKRAVSAEMALKLGRYFGVAPEIWTGLQADHDLEVARRLGGRRIDKAIAPCLPPSEPVGLDRRLDRAEQFGVSSLVRAERKENVRRKGFTPSESVVVPTIKASDRTKAKERSKAQGASSVTIKTADGVSKVVVKHCKFTWKSAPK